MTPLLPPSTAQAMREASAVLAAAGITDAVREARFLLAYHLGCKVSEAALLARDDLSALRDAKGFFDLIARRAEREPAAFITGSAGFWSLDLAVSPATLIPRADSETLIEAVISVWPDKSAALRVLDLGTGTGCLVLAVLSEYHSGFGVGVDRSIEAAKLARFNAIACGLGDRAVFVAGDWAGAIARRFDLVLSNPPYIPAADLAQLMPEVRDFEPRPALDGGADGLHAYRAIIGGLKILLAPGGIAVLELGLGQVGDVAQIAEINGFKFETRDDLGGIARAMILRIAEE